MFKSEHFDLALIDELRELMEGDFDTLLSTFISDSENKLSAIANAVSADNADDLKRTAHSLKGSSSNLGAVHLSELCFELEKMGRDNCLDLASQKLEDLRTSLSDATNYYQSLLGSR